MNIFFPLSTTYLKYYLWKLKVGGKTTVLALYACSCDMIQLIKHWGIVCKYPREVWRHRWGWLSDEKGYPWLSVEMCQFTLTECWPFWSPRRYVLELPIYAVIVFALLCLSFHCPIQFLLVSIAISSIFPFKLDFIDSWGLQDHFSTHQLLLCDLTCCPYLTAPNSINLFFTPPQVFRS